MWEQECGDSRPRPVRRAQLDPDGSTATRVERTLLSAAFDFVFELKQRDPPQTTVKRGPSAPRKAFGWHSTSSAAKKIPSNGTRLQPPGSEAEKHSHQLAHFRSHQHTQNSGRVTNASRDSQQRL